MKVSIIIPAHNEEKRISETLERYVEFFKRKIDFEIIIVLNACEDNTPKVVEKYGKKFKEIRVLDFKEKGKGFAIIEGFKDALSRENDLIGFVDADLATPPEAYYDLIENIKENDGVIASRWLKDSVIKTKQTTLRKITSRGFNFLTKGILFLPYKDTQCGAKLFKREALGKIINKIGITQWAFDVDLLYKARRQGLIIKEIPTVWEDKSGSKVNLLKAPFRMFSGIMRLRLLHSPFKFIVKIYDKLPEKIKVHH